MQDYLSDLYKRLSGKMKLGRERSEALMRVLRHPERAYPSIHVAGTNGKGSVTVIAAALLGVSGLRTGRFVSPHLVRFHERITVDDREIDDDAVRRYLKQWEKHIDRIRASFFEVSTALAFAWFRDREVDAAVIETGLGGRLDATNVLLPRVVVITAIDYDHTRILGNTLREIAGEKAGIIKKDVPVITVKQKKEVLEVFRSRTADLRILDPEKIFSGVTLVPGGMRFRMEGYDEVFRVPLIGRYQLGNIAMAVAAAEEFLGRPLKASELRNGFAKIVWKGRFEYIGRRPDIIYDVAHNPGGIRAFCSALKEIYPGKRIFAAVGILRDKHAEEALAYVQAVAEKIWLSPVDSGRSMDTEGIREMAERFPEVYPSENIGDACERAYRELPEHGVLCILGSHYIAKDVYEWGRKISVKA
ncbi:MAG: folylpolyglutamate synthase/dihydrofolate synthase family protein [Candidatus Marinimicrobia bacterium]|nr:folylpolyglutamate synthase/dihydrofolate synthase family protein [Candidatus Neomarinimicrobiota bacterium]